MDDLRYKITEMVTEMKDEAGERRVWAFIATYDKNGNLDWKAYAANEDDTDDVILGSEIVPDSAL
jgi:hypothetical protein